MEILTNDFMKRKNVCVWVYVCLLYDETQSRRRSLTRSGFSGLIVEIDVALFAGVLLAMTDCVIPEINISFPSGL